MVGLAATVGAIDAVGAEVAGRVAMPEACAPSVSPAVVTLEPLDRPAAATTPTPTAAKVVLVDQKALRFEPRVRALVPGQALKVSNGDSEPHDVHVLGDDGVTLLNQGTAPGRSVDFVPKRPGVLRLVCDIHSHMRGFVVVGSSPWTKVCSREGRFRFDDVPDGRYALKVWHELGDGLKPERTIEVKGGRPVDLGTITVAGRLASRQELGTAAARPWPEVVDRISVLLAASLDAAKRPDGFKRARALAQDTYFVEFHVSGMEVAVAQVLGQERKTELEEQFRQFYGPEIEAIARGKAPASRGADRSRALLLSLSKAAGDLGRQGVPDAAHLDHETTPATAPAAPTTDPRAALAGLERVFEQVRALADRGEADDAAATLAAAYSIQFDPIERLLMARDFAAGRRLEARYVALRGEVGAGLKGEALARACEGLSNDLDAALTRLEATPTGGFGPAFFASFGIILREGVEVILLLSMLFALVAKTVAPASRSRALAAIRWGVAAAALASAATAWGLNVLVASAQGTARELIEGLVLLAAAGLLFYVSYWLISQSESRRWMDFLKRQARQGAELGGFATLGLTAFLAVYREGAETALMYQAQLALAGPGRPGVLGLLAGLGLGLAVLAVLYVVIRSATVKLPLRPFFQATGVLLFAMAVVFAGKGVFELQSSGIVRVTPLAWLGDGLPVLGVYPNVQAVAVQGLLLTGAALAVVFLALERSPEPAKAAA
jgi:high-affinity iron transporter